MEWIPHIDWSALPEDEQEEARNLQTQLLALPRLEDQFTTAIELLEHAIANDDDKRWRWAAIAAGHAVLTIYHFRATMLAIKRRAGVCTVLKRRINTHLLHEVCESFDSVFPHWLPMRDSVAHAADKRFKSPFDYWGFIYEGGSVWHGLAENRTLTFAHEGRRYSQPINKEELEKLSRLRRAVFLAFRRVSLLPPPD